MLGINYQQNELMGPEMDFVIRFENIEEDFKEMCKLASLNSFPALNRARISIREEDYRSQYTEEMVGTVRNRFSNDIEMYNYLF